MPEMHNEQLRNYFGERVRVRIERRLQAIAEATQASDFDVHENSYLILSFVVILAEEENLARATDRIYQLKLANPATATSWDATRAALVPILDKFSKEVAILHDLHQMQAGAANCAAIIAHMEQRLQEDESHAGSDN